MMSTLYADELLAAAASLPPAKTLAAPDATARKASRVCGSELEIDLKVNEGLIADFALRVKACALGQASAGLFAQVARGANAREAATLRDQMRAFLKEGGPAPTGRWAPLAALEPIRDYPARHASALLIFDAVADALSQIGCGRPAAIR